MQTRVISLHIVRTYRPLLIASLRFPLVVAKMSYFSLDTIWLRSAAFLKARKGGKDCVPSLTWPPFIASHMATSAIETSMIDFPSLRFFLLSFTDIVLFRR